MSYILLHNKQTLNPSHTVIQTKPLLPLPTPPPTHDSPYTYDGNLYSVKVYPNPPRHPIRMRRVTYGLPSRIYEYRSALCACSLLTYPLLRYPLISLTFGSLYSQQGASLIHSMPQASRPRYPYVGIVYFGYCCW